MLAPPCLILPVALDRTAKLPLRDSTSHLAKRKKEKTVTPMDCSLPGSFVHGIFQVRILEWVAISYSRGISGLGSDGEDRRLVKKEH